MTIQSIKHQQDKRAHIPSREEAGTEAASPKVKGEKQTRHKPVSREYYERTTNAPNASFMTPMPKTRHNQFKFNK